MAPTLVIPPGGTVFSTFKRAFADIGVNEAQNNGISATEYIEAIHGFMAILDLIGNENSLIKVGMTAVRSDMEKNIGKIERALEDAGTQSATLQELVARECKARGDTYSDAQDTLAAGLVWMIRGLDFLARALADTASQTGLPNPRELKPSFQAGYNETLGIHHPVAAVKLVNGALTGCPYRYVLYIRLQFGYTTPPKNLKPVLTLLRTTTPTPPDAGAFAAVEAKVNPILESYVAGLKKIVDILHEDPTLNKWIKEYAPGRKDIVHTW